MLTRDYILEARELLAEADLEFDAGKTRKGSMLMWKAACAALSAVADKHGWPKDTPDDIKKITYRLDNVDEKGKSPRYPIHFAAFSVADGFREQAEEEQAEDYKYEFSEFVWSDIEIEMGRESVKEFIANLEKLVADQNISQ